VFYRFFIDRPIFACVISILIALAGALSYTRLSVSQFPLVTPPTIQVDCNYPGASSEVVAKTIAAPIEQRVNGVERMLYMSSQSTSDGTYTLTITFETGTNLNQAQTQVQNRVNLAIPELPETVRTIGVTARKRSPELLMTFALSSPNDTYDQVYLSNYASLHIKEVLARIEGVSDVTIFGQRDYSMRVWVDPDRLESRRLTVLDVVNAIRAQNTEVAMGKIGPQPGESNGPVQFVVSTPGRREDPEQFGDIIVQSGPDGQITRLRDVAKVALGARSSDVANRFDRKETVGLALFLQPDANALDSSEALKKAMKKLEEDFPPDIKCVIGYDTTPYIRSSIFEVFKALRDSIILVAIVVLVFLQSWRSALIPLATVPIAIVGTFGAMASLGFGLNNLTLFGLVLAVGIVVDDAIVVVEAVQQQIEKGFPPREATLRAMDEVTGPVIAVGAVLVAVFVPCAFFPGIVGQFFRQFALTIAVSTMISTFNSLTLCPALAALLLKSRDSRPDWPTRGMNSLFGWFFWLFNRAFESLGGAYTFGVRKLIRIPIIVLVVYGISAGLAYRGYYHLPMGFIPTQDKGYMIASVQLPDAASAERCQEVVDKLAAISLNLEVEITAEADEPGAKEIERDGKKKWVRRVKPIVHCNAVAGNSFVLSAYGSNFGSMFIILDTFDNRKKHDALYVESVLIALRAEIAKRVPEAQINIFGAPAVPGLGRAGGMKFMVQDRGEVGYKTLQGQMENLMEKGNQQPSLQGLFSVFKTNSPQLFVKINDKECVAAGVDPLDVYATMEATLGQRYVNDFNQFGRTWQVNVQADPRYRGIPEDTRRLKVRNKNGNLVPISALADVRSVSNPLVISRYNMYPAAAINMSVAPKASTGEAIAVMEQLANEQLPRNMGYEWTELTFLEQRSRDTGLWVFALAVLVVILVLAALYESWTLPFAVILVVPTCVASSLVGIWLTNWDTVAASDFAFHLLGREFNPMTALGLLKPDTTYGVDVGSMMGMKKQDVNIFTQVGFVVLIGLACKNSILIVEYAKWQREAGADRATAIFAACRQRLRPILMTSFAFILGVMPLAFATGAGSEMRRALGVAVLSGMLGVTIFGIFLTPVFFVVVDRLVSGRVFQSAFAKNLGTVLSYGILFSLLGLPWAVTWFQTSQRMKPKVTPTPPVKKEGE
jgi:multidrug efflux pump